jgi:hypothetical protein
MDPARSPVGLVAPGGLFQAGFTASQVQFERLADSGER